MGMSASQVRLLTITARIHDLENEAQRIQNQKLLLANESDEAYQEYLAALEQKNIQTLVFNNDTGTFNWNEVGVQGLCDNGYALKVKYLNAPSIYTSDTAMWQGITESTYLTQVYTIAPPTGFINEVEQITDFSDYASINVQNLGDNSITKYVINNANELTVLAGYVNQGNDLAGKTFVLSSDISGNMVHTSIGDNTNLYAFAGTFNGNGHKIEGLNRTLFEYVGDGATIENLELCNSNISAGTNDPRGILANKVAGATIDNCFITSSTVSSGPYAVGLIYSTASSSDPNAKLTINNCYVDNSVSIEDANYAAGLIGHSGLIQTEINNSYSCASFNNCNRIGGLVYTPHSTALAINNSYCTFQGDGASTFDMVGTMTYNNNSVTITNSAAYTDYALYGAMSNHTLPASNITNLGNLAALGISLTIDNEPFVITSDNFTNCQTVHDVLNTIQTKLQQEYPDSDFQITVGSDNVISISCHGHVVSNVECVNFVTNLTERIGLANGHVADTPEWTYCHSFAEVADALGCSANVSDSPAFLRDLIANAMAIVCTFEDVEEQGETVRHYTETSVSVDTHIKEEQNNSEMAKAEADYESALRKIDQKDKKYDKELAAIENQRSAVKEEFDTLKTCIKDNIDRTFKIFS